MFHLQRDASKVALMALVALMRDRRCGCSMSSGAPSISHRSARSKSAGEIDPALSLPTLFKSLILDDLVIWLSGHMIHPPSSSSSPYQSERHPRQSGRPLTVRLWVTGTRCWHMLHLIVSPIGWRGSSGTRPCPPYRNRKFPGLGNAAAFSKELRDA